MLFALALRLRPSLLGSLLARAVTITALCVTYTTAALAGETTKFNLAPAPPSASATPAPAASPEPAFKAAPAPRPSGSPDSLREIGSVRAQGRSVNLVGTADAASQGFVGAAQLGQRPIYRPGEVLEAIPGVVISQHSGEGKANQYYLRGFNLDHGTDLASFINGAPVNLPTHAHGQGYSDINWLIPELVNYVEFKKGPYYADEGDFSTAGSYELNDKNTLPALMSVQGGNYGEFRTLFAGAPKIGKGNLLYGLEYYHNDGPFDHPDNYRKLNAILRYSQTGAQTDFNVTAMAYDGRWNSTDQIPLRALQDGQIDRFGLIDPTDGGAAHRYALTTQWLKINGKQTTRFEAYAIDSKLDLFSNFSYYFDELSNAPSFTSPDQLPSLGLFKTGDQREQLDRRFVTGFRVSHNWQTRVAVNTIGVQVRNDNISTVGLFLSTARNRYATLDDDKVLQTSTAVFAQTELHLSPRLRTVLGVRGDMFAFNVHANDPANSGHVSAGILSPKATFAYQTSPRTEIYLNFGESYHSNDARGTTATNDPALTNAGNANTSNAPSLAQALRVTPLVRAVGEEIGLRYSLTSRLRSTIEVYNLNLNSELTFDGDHGTTSAGRPTQRVGFELANFWTPNRALTIDADYASAKASFKGDSAGIGTHVPGSLNAVASLGATVETKALEYGVRLRYFGPRVLIEDGSVYSNPTTSVNLRFAYKAAKGVRVQLDAFNVTGDRGSDIDYYYASTLPSDPYYTYPTTAARAPPGRPAVKA